MVVQLVIIFTEVMKPYLTVPRRGNSDLEAGTPTIAEIITFMKMAGKLGFLSIPEAGLLVTLHHVRDKHLVSTAQLVSQSHEVIATKKISLMLQR